MPFIFIVFNDYHLHCIQDKRHQSTVKIKCGEAAFYSYNIIFRAHKKGIYTIALSAITYNKHNQTNRNLAKIKKEGWGKKKERDRTSKTKNKR